MFWTDVNVGIDEAREHEHSCQIKFFVSGLRFRAGFLGGWNLVGQGKAGKADIDNLRNAILLDDDVDWSDWRCSGSVDQRGTTQYEVRKRTFAFGPRRSLRHDIVVSLLFGLVGLREGSRTENRKNKSESQYADDDTRQ